MVSSLWHEHLSTRHKYRQCQWTTCRLTVTSVDSTLLFLTVSQGCPWIGLYFDCPSTTQPTKQLNQPNPTDCQVILWTRDPVQPIQPTEPTTISNHCWPAIRMMHQAATRFPVRYSMQSYICTRLAFFADLSIQTHDPTQPTRGSTQLTDNSTVSFLVYGIHLSLFPAVLSWTSCPLQMRVSAVQTDKQPAGALIRRFAVVWKWKLKVVQTVQQHWDEWLHFVEFLPLRAV